MEGSSGLMFQAKGVFLVNAGSMSVDYMRLAGVTRVAHQLAVLGTDNDSTADNNSNMSMRKLAVPFAEHGGWGVNGADAAGDAAFAVARVRMHGLKFWIADTERYWLSGWDVAGKTEEFIGGMRAALGPNFPLAIVSFAYSPFGWQGAARNAGLGTCEKLGVAYIPEGYDEAGVTYGMEKFIPYYRREGVAAPSIVAIGDKSVSQDVNWLVTNPGNVSGVWVWAAEQTGDTLPSLKDVTLSLPAPPPPPPPPPPTPKGTRLQMLAAAKAMEDEWKVQGWPQTKINNQRITIARAALEQVQDFTWPPKRDELKRLLGLL